MKIALLSFLGIIIVSASGCSYPKLQIEKLDELVFENKRLEGTAKDIQEFIRPEETIGVLAELTLQDFSSNQEENLILNILNYTQQLKQIGDKKEFWQHPQETIKKGGDCEDKVFLLLSMLIQAGIENVQGVKGKYLGGGHMWVEYDGYILDPSKRTPRLILIKKSLGYIPYFKFNERNNYFCKPR